MWNLTRPQGLSISPLGILYTRWTQVSFSTTGPTPRTSGGEQMSEKNLKWKFHLSCPQTDSPNELSDLYETEDLEYACKRTLNIPSLDISVSLRLRSVKCFLLWLNWNKDKFLTATWRYCLPSDFPTFITSTTSLAWSIEIKGTQDPATRHKCFLPGFSSHAVVSNTLYRSI